MASSSSRNKVVLVDSDIEVIQDSEPERQKESAKQRSASSHASSSSSSRVAAVGSGKAIDTLASEDSDIELLPGGPVALRDSTNAIKKSKSKATRKADEGGFKSAAKLLKEETRKQRSSSPLPKALIYTSASKDKGKKKEIIDEFDFDDEVLELPPPLRSTSEPQASAIGTALAKQPCVDPSSDHAISEGDSPASAFRSKISSFKAPGQSRKGSSSKSLFASDSSSRSRSASAIIVSGASSLSDSSSASSSSKPSLSRPKSTSALPTKPSPLLVPTPFLTFITTCPVCKDAWTTIKTTNSKLAHIRKCATAKGFQEKTVLELVERQVREIQTSAEDERRRVESERTLFEDLVSKRGKDVQVVGVEQKSKKKKQAVGGSSGSDVENQPAIPDRPAVLYTQGGSAHSQATSSQVQREIDAKIKINQKVTRGDFVSILQPAGQSTTGKAPANGVGSKNWQKAAELLAARITATTSETSADISIGSTSASSSANVTSVTRTGKLESYATSRFRLAEKAKQISAARAAPVVLSDNDGSDSAVAGSSVHNNDLFPRPYRNTGRRSISLIDNASAIAKNLDYNLWSLAGSAQDTVPDRMVSTSPPAASSFLFDLSPSGGRSPSPQRLSLLLASASLSTSPSPAVPAPAQSFSSSSSSGPFASSAALQALTERMRATASRPTATALRKAREEKEKKRLQEEAETRASNSCPSAEGASAPEQAGDAEGTRVELDSDHATDSSAEIPLAKTAGPAKKPRGRPPKSKEDKTPSSILISPKRKKADKSSAASDSADDVPEPVKPKRKTTKLDITSGSTSGATKASTISTSMPATKKTSKPGTAVKAGKIPSQPAKSNMPDYDAWKKSDLQAETAKYGYKASGSKQVLITQLVRVWQALHPDEVIHEQESDGSVKTPAKSKTKAVESTPPWRAKPKASPSSEGSDIDALPEAPAKKVTKARKAASPALKTSKIRAPRKKKEKAAEEEVDTESEAEELKTAGQRLREIILQDEVFYLRLLRYEPICFTDFEELAIKAKVKISKIALRDWLDSQAIIFYYPQDTGRNASRNAQRKRHP